MNGELQEACRKAQEHIDGLQADQRARADALKNAEGNMADLKRAVVERKAELAQTRKSIEEAKKLRASGVNSKSSVAKDFQAAKRTYVKLEEAKKEFEPFKEAPIEGSEGKKRIQSLRKIGKEFGFHDVLLSALPAVLSKPLDKRRTFDGVAIKLFETEIRRHSSAAGAAVHDREEAVNKQFDAIQAAKQALILAKSTETQVNRALSEAEKAMDAGKALLKSCRQRVRSFDPNMRRATSDLSQAKARLDAFHVGPLAAYEALQAEFGQPRILPSVEATSTIAAVQPRVPADRKEGMPAAAVSSVKAKADKPGASQYSSSYLPSFSTACLGNEPGPSGKPTASSPGSAQTADWSLATEQLPTLCHALATTPPQGVAE
mmetsp:Transcript_75905/g.210691  ORF Transcript_75905/g.210691 Transcript_75905/m.210691 type:complete len:376 (+) Transcript_75905:331-1458(+)